MTFLLADTVDEVFAYALEPVQDAARRSEFRARAAERDAVPVPAAAKARPS